MHSAIRIGVVLASVVALLTGFGNVHAQSARRPGIRVVLASLHTGGGLGGRAFLPLSTRRIELSRPPDGPCGQGSRLVAAAELPRGAVRRVVLRLDLPPNASRDRVPIGSGCPAASIETHLEDGRVLSGGEGHIDLTGLHLRSGGAACGKLSQTVDDRGTPMSLRGSFHIPIP